MTMRKKRLTRKETQAQTRKRLIEAARTLFVRHGFCGTSLRDIAEEAGYSQGAFYSNFTCKDDILLELLKQHVSLEDDEIEAIMDNPALTDDEVLTAMEEWLQRFDTVIDWSILAIELQLHAIRNPPFAKRYARVWREHQRRVAVLTERIFARLSVPLPDDPQRLAAGFLAITNGLTVQEHAGRSNDVSATLMLFTRATLAAGQQVAPGEAR